MLLCVAIAPSPEGEDESYKHIKPVEYLGWAVEQLLDVLCVLQLFPQSDES